LTLLVLGLTLVKPDKNKENFHGTTVPAFCTLTLRVAPRVFLLYGLGGLFVMGLLLLA
jgi:hypothetical protein